MELTIHLQTENTQGLYLELWHSHQYRRKPQVFRPNGQDEDGPVFQIDLPLSSFHFAFHNLKGDSGFERFYSNILGPDIWCLADRADLYPIKPAKAKGDVNGYYQQIQELVPDGLYLPETDISYLRNGFPPVNEAGTKVRKSMLGSSTLKDKSVLFGFFHPRAAQVYLVGNFNDWQCPGHSSPDPEKFLAMELHRGYYDYPNIWLLRLMPDRLPQEIKYQYYVVGGISLDGNRRPERYVHDPFTRCYDKDIASNPSLVIDPSCYEWQSTQWKTPNLSELIIYEMNVYGFTEGDADIPLAEQGRFQGVMRRIHNGYFRDLGVNTLGLMPTSEAPTMQGPTALGYDPCGFASIERDFGTPDELRQLVDLAHQNDLAVLLDLVFNHTANSFNPLWDIISDNNQGGFYFSGGTPWGNRVATEREEVQDYLIDICKMYIKEYRVDGFRFDATHSDWMDHTLLHRLQYEIRDRGFKADCILIVENLPNQGDLNRDGWNGFAQWCDPFHDKMKALLREGVFQDWVNNSAEHLGDVFYYCRNFYAKHTNNSINYCESHDENSMPYEVGTDGPNLQTGAAKERKSRLGLMATVAALGQPMVYMGQEFDIDRPRNRIQFEWPANLKENNFYQWVRGLFNLRRRYPGLRMAGSNLIEEGRFTFIVGPWLDQGRDRVAIGWRANPSSQPRDQIVVLFNFEPYDVEVGVDFGLAGKWIKLADIDRVNDLPPFGNNSRDELSTIDTNGFLANFVLPSSSGFIYKWEH
jgi:1,4-alpha-glucan branching enzyme